MKREEVNVLHSDNVIDRHIDDVFEVIQKCKKLVESTPYAALELERIEEVKRLRKQIIEEEKRHQISLLVAQQSSECENDAACKLQKFYHLFVTDRIRQREEKLRTHRVVFKDIYKQDDVKNDAAIKIQKQFRSFSVSVYLRSKNIDVRRGIRSPSDVDIVAERVEVDFKNRRFQERRDLIGRNTNYLVFLEKTFDYLLNLLDNEHRKREDLRDDFWRQNESQRSTLNSNKEVLPDTPTNDSSCFQCAKDRKMLKIRTSHTEWLKSIEEDSIACIQDQLRFLVKSKLKSFAITKEERARLKKIEETSKIARSLFNFIEYRINRTAAEDSGLTCYRNWLQAEKQKMIYHLKEGDILQEAILHHGNQRLHSEIKVIANTQDRLVLILDATDALKGLEIEKMCSEIELLHHARGTEGKLTCLERIKSIQERRIDPQRRMIASTKTGLNSIHSIEEKKMLTSIDFVGDVSEPTLQQMGKMKAILCKKEADQSSQMHLCEEEWKEMFWSQPWLAQQAYDESFFETSLQRRRALLKARFKVVGERKKQLKFDRKRAEATEQKISELIRHSKMPDRSIFKKKELIAAADQLEKILQTFRISEQDRDDLNSKEEHQIHEELAALDVEAKKAKERRLAQQRVMELFCKTELKDDIKLNERLEIEKEWLELEKLRIDNAINEECGLSIAKGAIVPENNTFLKVQRHSRGLIPQLQNTAVTCSDTTKMRVEEYEMRLLFWEEESIKIRQRHDKREELAKKIEAEMKQNEKQRNAMAIHQDIRERRNKLLKAKKLHAHSNECTPEIIWDLKGADLDVLLWGKKKPRDTRLNIANEMIRQVGTKMVAFKKLLPTLINNRHDPEKDKMIETVRKMMILQQRKVEAVGKVTFTVSKRETEQFEIVNKENQSKGRPYYRRLQRQLGAQEQIVLWIQMTVIQSEFITDMKLGDTQPGSPNFFNGKNNGMSSITHERMKGSDSNDPTMCMWYKKDNTSSDIITDLMVSFTKEERKEIIREGGYSMIPTCLSTFGLARCNIWVQKSNRSSLFQLTDSGHMNKEYDDYMQMLSKNPNDPILREMAEKLRRRIRTTQIEEEIRTMCVASNPVEYAADFLAIDSTELVKIHAIYEQIDQDNDEYISVDEYCRFVCQPTTLCPFIRHIFAVSSPGESKSPKDDKLDFGSTLKATSMFCMFSSDEILQLIFSMYDFNGYGRIKNDDFLLLLTMFHTRHRGPVTRALREFDLPEQGCMTYGTFRTLHHNFPHLFYPALKLQVSSAAKNLSLITDEAGNTTLT